MERSTTRHEGPLAQIWMAIVRVFRTLKPEAKPDTNGVSASREPAFVPDDAANDEVVFIGRPLSERTARARVVAREEGKPLLVADDFAV